MKGLHIFLVITISNCWIQIVLPKPMEHGRLNSNGKTSVEPARAFGIYRIEEQTGNRRAGASTQSRQSLRYSHTQSMNTDEETGQISSGYAIISAYRGL